MKKTSLFCIMFAFVLSACAFGGGKPAKSQLEIREFQTREFDTKNQKMVMKALINVLQDEGFIIKNADSELGFMTATKERDVESTFKFNYNWNDPKSPPRYAKTESIDATANITELANKCRVRVTFSKKILDNFGGVMEVGQIDDEKFYQDFFSKVDKGIFLQKEKL